MREVSVIVVQSAAGPADAPGIEDVAGSAELRFAPDAAALARTLPGADVLLGWDFKARLEDAWASADSLRWIHWCGAGVDSALFPALVESDVVVTNARGVFDGPMAEYTLGLILAFAKRLPETLRLQARSEWRHRLTECVTGTRALVVGAGSIGRTIARMLVAAGIAVEGVGRRARDGDPDFGTVHAVADLNACLPHADWVVLVAPLTADTEGLIGPEALAAMKPGARLLNLGRGGLVHEKALIEALADGRIAGAALDVFRQEPLPPESPFWTMEQVIVSPHMSADFVGFGEALMAVFSDNLRRWREGGPLLNVVDKRLGFVPADVTD